MPLGDYALEKKIHILGGKKISLSLVKSSHFIHLINCKWTVCLRLYYHIMSCNTGATNESMSLVSFSRVSMCRRGDPFALWSTPARTMWPFWVIPIGFYVRGLPGVD